MLDKLKAAVRRNATGASKASSAGGRWIKRILIGAVALLLVFAVIGFFIAPPLAKHYAVKMLSTELQRPVSIQKISLNPFAMQLSIKGVLIRERDGKDTFVSLEELFLNLAAWESIWRRAPVLDEIRVTQPYVHIVRLDPKTYNFSDIMGRIVAKSAKPRKEPVKPARFSLNNIQIRDGRVDFDDRPKANKHAVTAINLALPFISNLPYLADRLVQPALSGIANGTPFSIEGQTKPFKDSLETVVEINIDDLSLPKYIEYVPTKLDFKVPSGLLDILLTVSFTRYEKSASVLQIRGNAGLENLALTEFDGQPLLNLPVLDVPINSIDVFNRAFDLGVIALSAPEIYVRRSRDGSLNWLAAMPKPGASSGPAPPAAEGAEAQTSTAGAAPLQLSIAEVKVTEGQVHVEDQVPAKALKADLVGIAASVQNITLPEKQPMQFAAAFTTAADEGVNLSGKLSLSPLASEGTVEATKVRLKNYEPYYEHLILYTLEEGIADLSTKYSFEASAAAPLVRLTDFNLGLTSVRFRKRGANEDFLRVKSARIGKAEVDVNKLKLSVGEFTTQDGFVNVVREADGAFNVTRILPAPQAAPADTAAAAAIAERKEARQGTQWLIALQRAEISRWKVAYTDLMLREPVTFAADNITLKASGLSNEKDRKGTLSLQAKLGERGRLATQGRLGINPVAAELDLDLAGFDLVPLQPYFEDRVNIVVSSGDATVRGKLTLQLPPGASPLVTYKGDAAIAAFASVDKVNSEDFLKWNSLFLSGIDTATTEPFALSVGEVALTDFFARLIIYPDGRLNLANIMATDEQREAAKRGESPQPGAQQQALATAVKEAPARSAEGTKLGGPPTAGGARTIAKPAPSASKPLPNIKIAKVTLQGGDVNFTDLFIKPNYSANVTDLGGSVTGLSSELNTTADVELRARYARTAPVEIKGKVNPLVANLFLDLKANVRDIELGPFSPYSGKYVGYAIAKGKMSFDVEYLVQDRKLAAKNKLVLDQLTFGEKVPSPDAIKLPVLLAVSLLKDRNGVININLPLSGTIDDPKFSVWGLVWQVVVNLITKAATAPFALIGAMFGDAGGEELSFVEFEYGRATLTPKDAEKLDKLRSALKERPAIKLDIGGQADAEKDREGLRQYKFDSQVKAQKLKDLVKQGSSVKSLDAVKIDPAEYEKYLKRAYKDAKFPKPRNVIGIAKDLPKEEMEKLMLTNTGVDEDDLIQLANNRAQAAKEAITQGGDVAVDRVFILAPKVETAKADAKQTAARVEFSLK